MQTLQTPRQEIEIDPKTPLGDQRTISPARCDAVRRRIRVLHVLNTETRGGIEEGVLSLVRNLDRGRFAPALACPPKLIEAYGRDLEGLGIDVYSIPPVSRPYQIRALCRLARVLREASPDVVHTHLFIASLCVAPLAKLCGVPVVVESCRIHEAWRRGIWKHYWVDRWVNRWTNANIAISESLQHYLIEEKRLPASKVVLIRNGRELVRVVAPSKREAAALRKELDLLGHELVLVAPGRLEPQKGHRYLLQALPEVLQHFPGLRVLLVGEGSLRTELESEIERLALGKNVLLTGYRSDVYDLIRLADLVVLPSLFEGLPLVAIEAGVLGKAIVATSVDGTPEVVLHGETGWLVPPADSDALGRGICRLLADAELRARMGAQAQEYVTREYSFGRLVDRTEQLYARLCQQLVA